MTIIIRVMVITTITVIIIHHTYKHKRVLSAHSLLLWKCCPFPSKQKSPMVVLFAFNVHILIIDN